MKLNLIFLSVVLVMQYEWLGVNCDCQNIDNFETFKAKTQGGKAAVLLLKCGTTAPTIQMTKDTQAEMEKQCVSKNNIPCYQNDFGDDATPESFRSLDFPICPAFFLFKDGKQIKRGERKIGTKDLGAYRCYV
ncbi:uncharacterized protein LOC111045873 isoform X1 [Nilaparvata lugens]|uniref:uncharacterized protein LOC111045873 isoform X1 n=1 Tax=Nilaparvata lugens TaxID=108931 RepID=UPI00193CF70B|nr:uncharacterized protein LOC111045873 isoform X1 [Nilaparvata lugens]